MHVHQDQSGVRTPSRTGWKTGGVCQRQGIRPLWTIEKAPRLQLAPDPAFRKLINLERMEPTDFV